MKPEAELQCKIVHFLRLNNILCFAPCSEMFMTLNRGGNFGLFQHYVNMGFEKGVLDVWLFKSGKTFVIECKAPGKKTSKDQDGFIVRLNREQIPNAVIDNYYDFLDQLFKWGVIREMPMR